MFSVFYIPFESGAYSGTRWTDLGLTPKPYARAMLSGLASVGKIDSRNNDFYVYDWLETYHRSVRQRYESCIQTCLELCRKALTVVEDSAM